MDMPLVDKGVEALQRARLRSGGLIDRSEVMRFHFDGRPLTGYRGDTLASALLANDVRLVARSFKYHRPRGILTAGPEEPNALVGLGHGAYGEPNTRATAVELFDGLTATSQNRWPSLEFDLMAAVGVLSPLFVAGFYYKTFMWPASFWERVYEPAIRRAAGLGRATALPDPDFCEKVHAFCDLLVVGGGPAGLMAAHTAARAGARVIVCEEDFVPGGRLLADEHEIAGQPGARWAAEMARRLEHERNVRFMTRTAVFGAYDGNTYAALETLERPDGLSTTVRPRLRYWKIVARRCVIAAGATERMIAFGGNDRPGVMLGGAVRTYVGRYAVKPGNRAAVFTSNDSGWTTAQRLAEAGMEVVAVVDTRAESAISRNVPDARALWKSHVTDVRGRRGVRAIEVESSRGVERFDVDLLAVSGGWNPNAALATHAGARLAWNETLGAFTCAQPGPGMTLAGAANARWTLRECLLDGVRAGEAAAEALGLSVRAEPAPDCSPEADGASVFWRSPRSRGKAFVDQQNDVTVRDVEIAAREGFDCPEHLKRYTTLGMATDQGKTSGIVGQGVLAEIRGQSLAELGTTAHRPPVVPVAVGAIANRHTGKSYRPLRRSVSDDWAQERGAVFAPAGAWRRAKYFPRSGDAGSQTAVDREVGGTRGGVGICDVSTLGKIEVEGRDAALFLDRVYSNLISTLPCGRARYGLMLREDGIVLDDGTVARLGDSHYVLSTTTIHAEEVLRHLEFCGQVLWSGLDVQLTAVTEHWAQFAVAGPRSRDLLQRIVDAPFDISNEAFPYLSVAPLTVCGGVTARLFRISFSGELAYEVAVPARFGDALLRRLFQVGEPLECLPYGTEALNVMRVEKGHIGSAEINGRTSASDLGLGKLLSTKKDYVGRVLATRPGLRDPQRPTLIGLVPRDHGARIRAGAHLLGDAARSAKCRTEGHITSAMHSVTLGHAIALGFLPRGSERIGEVVRVLDPLQDSTILARVCSPVFFDTGGLRVRS